MNTLLIRVSLSEPSGTPITPMLGLLIISFNSWSILYLINQFIYLFILLDSALPPTFCLFPLVTGNALHLLGSFFCFVHSIFVTSQCTFNLLHCMLKFGNISFHLIHLLCDISFNFLELLYYVFRIVGGRFILSFLNSFSPFSQYLPQLVLRVVEAFSPLSENLW